MSEFKTHARPSGYSEAFERTEKGSNASSGNYQEEQQSRKIKYVQNG